MTHYNRKTKRNVLLLLDIRRSYMPRHLRKKRKRNFLFLLLLFIFFKTKCVVVLVFCFWNERSSLMTRCDLHHLMTWAVATQSNTQLFIKMDTRNTIEFIAFFNDRLFIITVFLCYRNFFFNFSLLLFIRHLTLGFLRIKKVSRDCLVFLCNNYIIIYK